MLICVSLQIKTPQPIRCQEKNSNPQKNICKQPPKEHSRYKKHNIEVEYSYIVLPVILLVSLVIVAFLFSIKPIMVMTIINNDFNHDSFVLSKDFTLQNPQIAFAFHTQAIQNASSSLQEIAQYIDSNLNKTKQSLQNNDTTQALSYLQTAQKQLDHLKNSTLVESMYSSLLQSVISSPSSLLSQSEGSVGSGTFPSSSSFTASPVLPPIPQTQAPSPSTTLPALPESLPESTSSTAPLALPEIPTGSSPSSAQLYAPPLAPGSFPSSDLDELITISPGPSPERLPDTPPPNIGVSPSSALPR